MHHARAVRSAVIVLAMLGATFAHGQTGGKCELCGDLHAAQAPVYVTDWETNLLHRYGALDCALEAMRTQFEWSRAAVADNSTGERITVTRAQGKWTVRPEDSVVVVRPADDGGECAAYDYYASRDEFVRYTKKHKRAARAGPPPERLADFVDAYVGRHGGTPAPPVGQASQAATAAAAGPVAQERPDPPWTGDAVETVQAEGIMEGYPDGTFKGDGEVTRYEMAVIAQRLLQRMGQRHESGEETAGAPAGPSTRELVAALEEDLTAAGANRGEVAAALKVLNDAADEGVTIPAAVPMDTDWPDVPDDHWASDAVRAVTQAGVMNGYPDNTFQGENPLTRYEIAVIAARLLGIAARAAPSEEGEPAGDMAPPPESESASDAPTPPPTDDEPTEGSESPSAEAHLRGLRAQLLAQGMTDEEADRLLQPVRRAMEEPATPTEATTAPPAPPTGDAPQATPPTDEDDRQAAMPAGAESPGAAEAPVAPLVQEPNMLGVSGFLLTPSADTSANSDSIRIGLSRALGSNLLFGNTSAVSDLELTLLSTSGDMPSRILIGGKKQIWRSSDGRSRVAVGILDATDEIDSTIYGAYSKSLRSHFWSDTPRDWTLTVGLGAGDLLDGIFASAYSPVNENLSVGAEIVDFGDSGMDLNYGLEYKLGRGWQIKAGIVDGDLAAEATIETDL